MQSLYFNSKKHLNMQDDKRECVFPLRYSGFKNLISNKPFINKILLAPV